MKYNADINFFGGIQDYHMIHEALRSFFSGENDFKERLVEKNEFAIRTAEARGRFYRGIKSSILKFKNDNHLDLYYSFFHSLDEGYPYDLLVFWLLAQNNLLFRKLSTDVYLKFYFNGKVSITGEDVFAYLKHLQQTDEVFGKLKWTKNTMEPVASKYLTILRKLNLLEGKNKKHIKHVQLSDTDLVVYLYILKSCSPQTSNILTSDFIDFSFMTAKSLNERVKKIAQKGWFQMTYTVMNLNIEPTISYNKLAHAIF